MSRLLSHIVQKKFAQVNEDIATDALVYIIQTSQAASAGMRKFLCGLLPDLPVLHFRTQQAEEGIRPDVWGYEEGEPRVFIENKFWAGLTDNQPVKYLRKLSSDPKPTLLLVVAPAARQHTLWSELERRVREAGLSLSSLAPVAGVGYAARTSLGPILAITSWTNLLSVLEHATVDDSEARGDLIQLHALCEAADSDAFFPVSREKLSDQIAPSFILELSSIWRGVTDLGISRAILDTKGTTPQASWERIGRYTYFNRAEEDNPSAGFWFGIHFRLWKKHGMTPLWAVFPLTDWGKAGIVKAILEPWGARMGVFTADDADGSFVVALELLPFEERDVVIKAILTRLKEMRQCWLERPILQGKEEEGV